MTRIRPYIAAVAFSLVTALPAVAFDVPSGQPLELQEVIVDKSHAAGVRLRFRFVAPRIARDSGGISYEQAEPDMLHLCENTAIPYMADYDLVSDQIVISFSDRVTEFGKPDPAATQFFEAYSVENNTCILEAF